MRRPFVGLVAVAAALLPVGRAASGPPGGGDEEGIPGGAPLLAAMHRQFDDVRGIHRALIFGDLGGARRRARSLERISPAWGPMVGGEVQVERIRAIAGELSRARTPRAARRQLTNLAAQCAGCHAEGTDASRFIWSPEPSDDGSAAARMARHRWASESAWMGLIAPSDERWRDGMDALATIPLPVEAMSDDRARYLAIERLGRRLAARARRARALDDAAGRATAMAGLIEVCAACHELAR